MSAILNQRLRGAMLSAGRLFPRAIGAQQARQRSDAALPGETSYTIDAWAQPPLESYVKNVPEMARFIRKSKSHLDFFLNEKVGPEQMIEMMDHAHVDKVFLSAISRKGSMPISNKQIKEFTDKYPDRFYGIGSVDISKPTQALTDIEKVIKDYGFKGIRLLPWLWDMPVTSSLFYPVFAKCVELDVPFCTQVGHSGPLLSSEYGRPVPYIDQVAIDFPELRIVCGHIGFPWTQEMIGVAWKHKNVFIDSSAHYPKYFPKEFVHFANTYGSEKCLFGSNFPDLTWEKCASQARQLDMKHESLEKFMWKNANKVFKLGLKEPVQPPEEVRHDD